MLAFWVLSLLSPWAPTLVHGAPAPRGPAQSAYAPVKANCPSDPLLRPAEGLNPAEQTFLEARKPVADKALASWLSKIDPSFHAETLPGLAFLSSGGGHRSVLTSSGVIQAMDARENKSPLGGLWQAMLYHAGNSGGSWLVSALAANNWMTISDMTRSLWTNTLNAGLAAPPPHRTYDQLFQDLFAKLGAGFEITMSDIWGRLLSDQFIMGSGSGNGLTFSGLAENPSFKAGAQPLPILAALTVDTAAGQCMAGDTAIHFEVSPFEFGSWEDGVAAFTPTKYLGTHLVGGKPSRPSSTSNSTIRNNGSDDSSCTTGYDNVGFVFGAASDMFNEACDPNNLPIPDIPIVKQIAEYIEKKIYGTVSKAISAFADMPNPFYQSPISGTASYISSNPVLSVIDGGEENENNPIWPFLRTNRPVDVLFVNDNSADSDEHYPTGYELQHTSQKARAAGITKMPEIPSLDFFNKTGSRPTFFGCKDPKQITIVYLMNKAYTFPSGFSTYKFSYNTTESAGMIQNGNAIATLNGDDQWPMCVACAIMQKTETNMPQQCGDCLTKYCYN